MYGELVIKVFDAYIQPPLWQGTCIHYRQQFTKLKLYTSLEYRGESERFMPFNSIGGAAQKNFALILDRACSHVTNS